MKPARTVNRWLTRLAFCLGAALAGCASVPGVPPAPAADVAPAAPAQTTVVPVAVAAAPAASAAAAEPEITIRPPLPRTRLDPQQDAERADLWQRIRDGYAIPTLDHDLVRKWEQYYSARPDYVRRMAERGGRYLFHIVEEIDRRGMPLDLALLPFVESAFDPQALSRARASGMWQFMPGTGKDFELRQNVFRDDRRDVLESTRAALDYLAKLHQRFGDWHLALAAYNWGQGNVIRAAALAQRAGSGAEYTSLRMPDETRNYVPKLQAMKNLVARPADFNLALPPLENHPFFVSVDIEQDIDVALVARLAELPLEQFQQLNPQLDKPVILAAGTPRVLLPYDNANHLVRALQSWRGQRASWTAWVAPRNMKPAEVAKMVGMTEPTLREVNRIPARMVVKVGSTLLVPRGAHATANVAEHIADHASIAFAPEAKPQRRGSVRVARGGETVAALARRVGMRPDELARLNGVAVGARFAGGQPVKVWVREPTRRVATPAQVHKRPVRTVRPVRTAAGPGHRRVR